MSYVDGFVVPVPDGKRMFRGGFEVIVDEGQG